MQSSLGFGLMPSSAIGLRLQELLNSEPGSIDIAHHVLRTYEETLVLLARSYHFITVLESENEELKKIIKAQKDNG